MNNDYCIAKFVIFIEYCIFMSLNKKNYLDEELWNCVFNNQISDDIRWAIHSDRCLVAAQLLLAAIDVISGIDRPKNQAINTGSRYISWCNTYIKMTGEHYKLTGNDLWGARCGFLHGYTHLSTEVKSGRARILSFVDNLEYDLISSPLQNVNITESPANGLVIVSLKSLFNFFCLGSVAMRDKIKEDENLTLLVNSRLQNMFQSVDLKDSLKQIGENEYILNFNASKI